MKAETLDVCLAAVCAGLAIYMTISKFVFAFPIIPYLKFEFAEIPVVVAFFAAGPIWGLASSFIYWIVLTLVGEWTPLGPAMKFLAVMPMLVGLWTGYKLHQGFLRRKWGWKGFLAISLPFAAVFRVIVTSFLNYIVLWYLFPFFLNIASTSIKATVGLDVPSPVAALIWTLIFTAAFNILHILLSIIPSYIVVKMISKAGITKLWITEIAKETDC